MTRNQISVAMSDELLIALDREAFRLDQSRAAAVRWIIGDYLRDVGHLRFTDPLTTATGESNRFFRARGGRA
ncbi:MAG: hypothetical protein MIN69_13740 [Methylorubrum extorquens]|jgi:metal-responsive CopG/Arc/MetJ family transcriptional regulator|uniref:hypothetical protein n=1 Tax=Methylorubrum extorquens TaxID=408 RepID=UPI002FEE230A